MKERSGKSQKSNTRLEDLVTVVCVDDAELAQNYETLLKSNYIPAAVKHRRTRRITENSP